MLSDVVPLIRRILSTVLSSAHTPYVFLKKICGHSSKLLFRLLLLVLFASAFVFGDLAHCFNVLLRSVLSFFRLLEINYQFHYLSSPHYILFRLSLVGREGR